MSCFKVYSFLITFMSNMTPEARKRLEYYIYDDNCHLSRFSRKKHRMEPGSLGEASNRSLFYAFFHVLNELWWTIMDYDEFMNNILNKPEMVNAQEGLKIISLAFSFLCEILHFKLQRWNLWSIKHITNFWIVQMFGNLTHKIDRFHAVGHVDLWCQKNMRLKKTELPGLLF